MKKKKPTAKVVDSYPLHGSTLIGYAVLLDGKKPRIEYWAYNPSILTKLQREKLGICGWKTICVTVMRDQHG